MTAPQESDRTSLHLSQSIKTFSGTSRRISAPIGAFRAGLAPVNVFLHNAAPDLPTLHPRPPLVAMPLPSTFNLADVEAKRRTQRVNHLIKSGAFTHKNWITGTQATEEALQRVVSLQYDRWINERKNLKRYVCKERWPPGHPFAGQLITVETLKSRAATVKGFSVEKKQLEMDMIIQGRPLNSLRYVPSGFPAEGRDTRNNLLWYRFPIPLNFVKELETTDIELLQGLEDRGQSTKGQNHKRGSHLTRDYCCWSLFSTMPYFSKDYTTDLPFSQRFVEDNRPLHSYLGHQLRMISPETWVSAANRSDYGGRKDQGQNPAYRKRKRQQKESQKGALAVADNGGDSGDPLANLGGIWPNSHKQSAQMQHGAAHQNWNDHDNIPTAFVPYGSEQHDNEGKEEEVDDDNNEDSQFELVRSGENASWRGGDLLFWHCGVRVAVARGEGIFLAGKLILHQVGAITGKLNSIDFSVHQSNYTWHDNAKANRNGIRHHYNAKRTAASLKRKENKEKIANEYETKRSKEKGFRGVERSDQLKQKDVPQDVENYGRGKRRRM